MKSDENLSVQECEYGIQPRDRLYHNKHALEEPFPEKTWRFLTGREEQIRKVAESIGYSYDPGSRK